ncbi:MAG: type II CRISPR-associated endonuclease Cas1 [Clostridia bacterium]|nr:type II CRISPR-associated endonuclease Cas1 [Clostridia bacterium]
MGFRTVVVKNRAKLDYKLNYLVCRADKETRVFIPEISVLIVESTGVSITSALLSELIKNKVKVIFCDEKHIPHSQLIGLYDNFHSSKNVLKQIEWENKAKQSVWQNIVYHKILNQSKVLFKYGFIEEVQMLLEYLSNITLNDSTNREGHAAKVYFNALFNNAGRRIPSFYNSALNYGYAILLSAFCREITASGYITQLGIWHSNEFNHYNLASDLMESFRVIVDEMVLDLDDKCNFKIPMANILNAKVRICGKTMFLDNAIEVYTKGIFNALETGDISSIKNFESYELPIYENDCDV